MRVGLLSDTHDRLEAAAAAMKVLRDAQAEAFLHAGDVGSEQIIDLLAGENAAFVWGNNDLDRGELARYADQLGVKCLNNFGEITLGGKLFAITHGDDQRRIDLVLKDQRHDYLITGHTHQKHDQRIGKVRWINPGALHRAREKTVAILDTEKEELRFLVVAC
jgi:putative phosphoesterase